MTNLWSTFLVEIFAIILSVSIYFGNKNYWQDPEIGSLVWGHLIVWWMTGVLYLLSKNSEQNSKSKVGHD